MCGFLFYFDKNKVTLSDKTQQSIKDILLVRGPDHYETLKQDHFYFAHGRLSIIDPTNEHANQPIQGPHEVFAFNGQIYNFKDFDAHETSDTLLLFKKFSQSQNFEDFCRFLQGLRGFYAFTFLNQRTKEITIARDPFAKKPLYYYHHDNKLIASSSIKAIKCLVSNLTPDEVSQKEFMLMGRIRSPRTQYRQISQALPGEVIRFSFNLEIQNKKIISLKNGDPDLPYAFEKSVQRRFVSDVPVGLLLSSGYDSSVILGAAKKLNLNTQCFTLVPGFSSKLSKDESSYSINYAESLGYKCTPIHVNEKVIMESYQEFLSKMELPSIDGLNIFIATKFIKGHVKVLLMGSGGDEVQERYAHYRYNWLPSTLSTKVNFLKRAIFRKTDLTTALSLATKEPTYQSMHEADLYEYLIPTLLRDGDWASMCNSVEIRCPFVDMDLWAKSLKYGGNSILEETKKYDLRIEKPVKLGFEMPVELLFGRKLSRYECLIKMRDLAWEHSLK